MAKKISLLDIAKSKLSSKEGLPEWYDKRLSICASCPFNSVNKARSTWTAQDIAWSTLNGGKPFCTACGCELKAKASLPHAVCGLKDIGIAPKWKEVGTVAKNASLEIINISTTPLKISEEKGEIILDYGTIKIGQETDVQIIVKDLDNNMTDISTGTSCGCTVSKLEKIGNEIILKIDYNTKRVGEFTKTVVLAYKKNNMDFKKIFKITGKTE